MTIPGTGTDANRAIHYTAAAGESALSAVSWASIIGGAVAATAVSLLLLSFGAGIGFASVSPWSHASGKGFSIVTAIWFIVMQWLSAGIGGYLAGRLRVKWAGLHSDEVFFRDTAHGFLAWALATVITAGMLTSVTSAIVGAGAEAVSSVAAGAATAGAAKAGSDSNDANGYFVDSLFRSDHPVAATPADNRAESARIIARGVKDGDVSEADRTYLAQLISNQTGLSQPEAAKRVDDTITEVKAAEEKVKQAADDARKAAARASFFTCFSLLIGAFIACVAAALGGRQRDEY